MNIPHVIWEGTLDEGALSAILEAIKKLISRRGKLMWLDTD